ncbi:Protein_phosphatase PP2A regulatory subunit B [Hexamita inflata]|uniref:Serine/threonine-protein phosphatase 2A 55 kDa regulatory subunit B n=1 Tax=Hexamita inflata TaxID=28002 RepID=A0ABP1K291_9EUKA
MIKHNNYKFSQSFGAEQENAPIQADDVISQIEFSDDSRLLAVGDVGGRVIMFQRKDTVLPQFSAVCEFTAHYRQFDVSRSQEVSSEILSLKFLPPTHDGQFLVTASERDVRLFKIAPHKNYKPNHNGSLLFPSIVNQQLQAVPKRLYQNASNFHLNSLSVSAGGDSFLVADDFSVTQFWVQDHLNGFLLIDNQMNSLDQKMNLITTARFHPQDSNLILAGYSTGQLRLYDLRANLKQTSVTVPGVGEIQDIQVNPPNLVFARTAQYLSVYDIRNLHKPLFQNNMNPKLNFQQQHKQQSYSTVESYQPVIQKQEHETKFNIAISKDQQFWASGFYGNQIEVGNLNNDVLGWKATRILKKYKADIPGNGVGAKLLVNKGQTQLNAYGDQIQGKVEKVAFGDDVLVAASGGNLFLYGW